MNRKKLIWCLALVAIAAVAIAITHPRGATFASYKYYPNNAGLQQEGLKPLEECNLQFSDQYKAYVTIVDAEGVSGEEQEIDVLMSPAIWWNYWCKEITGHSKEGTDGKDLLHKFSKGRTFSYVSVSFNPRKGERLKFRIEAIGELTARDGATLLPSNYALESKNKDDKSVEFTVTENNKYISVNFNDKKNSIEVIPDTLTWVKHMLVVSVDPVEKNAPQLGESGVVNFATATEAEVREADVIYFAPGCYNFTEESRMEGTIRTHYQGRKDGRFTLRKGQTVYIAGGAFVEGYFQFEREDKGSHIIRGRGVISGAQYTWQTPPYVYEKTGHKRSKYQIMQLTKGGDKCHYEGIHVVDSPQHGMVAGERSTARNIKFLGWHCNNDGIRFGRKSDIRNCFMRCCDDFFYNYDLDVEDCVLWPAYNGSIMTFGWRAIDIGGSYMRNIDIINCEWTNMGNNKGIIMSQNDAGFNIPDNVRPYTIFENIRVDGPMAGFVNIKLGSNHYTYSDNPDAKYSDDYGTKGWIINDRYVDADELGWLGNIRFKNVRIDGQFQGVRGNRIVGATGVVRDEPNSVWEVRDIYFEDVYIGGVKLTEKNKGEYFTLNPNTTSNIIFDKE